MAKNTKAGSLFVVSLQGVKLTREVETKVAGEIQAAVMRGLAAVDFQGELNTKFPRDLFPGGRTIGIWIGDPPVLSR